LLLDVTSLEISDDEASAALQSEKCQFLIVFTKNTKSSKKAMGRLLLKFSQNRRLKAK